MEAQLSHQSINLHLGNPGLMLLSQDEILNTTEFSELYFQKHFGPRKYCPFKNFFHSKKKIKNWDKVQYYAPN